MPSAGQVSCSGLANGNGHSVGAGLSPWTAAAGQVLVMVPRHVIGGDGQSVLAYPVTQAWALDAAILMI